MLTSMTWPSHRRAAASTGSGSESKSPNGSSAGSGSVPMTAKPGAAIRWEANTTDSMACEDRSRTAVPTSATT